MWTRHVMWAVSFAPMLVAGCQVENPGFKLIDGATAGTGATGSTTGEGTSGGAPGSSGSGGGDSSGGGSGSGTGAGTTGASESDGGTTGAACVPMTPCYTGAPGSADVGSCHAGLSACTPLGEFATCEGEVVPMLDLCATAEDEDCNGSVDGCAECMPGASKPCYSGLPGTEGLGECIAGTRTCSDKGFFWACVGEVTPMREEICGNELDDDCNGTKDDGC